MAAYCTQITHSPGCVGHLTNMCAVEIREIGEEPMRELYYGASNCDLIVYVRLMTNCPVNGRMSREISSMIGSDVVLAKILISGITRFYECGTHMLDLTPEECVNLFVNDYTEITGDFSIGESNIIVIENIKMWG